MAEEGRDDSDAMCRFAGLDLGDDRIRDTATILNFGHFLERHVLTEVIHICPKAADGMTGGTRRKCGRGTEKTRITAEPEGQRDANGLNQIKMAKPGR